MASHSFLPDNFDGLKSMQLLRYFDNPKNFNIPDHSSKVIALGQDTFPKNTTLLLTHGLFSVNSKDRKAVVEQIETTKTDSSDVLSNESETRDISRKQAYRLMRNFSDFGTRKVVEHMFTLSGDTWFKKEDDDNYVEGKSRYPENVIIPVSPRIMGDPARAVDADDFKRDADFNGNILLSQEHLTSDVQGEANHDVYHKSIEHRLTHIEETQEGSITFDIHDTGVNLMGLDSSDDIFREGGYPEMEIGTLEGDSCNPEILEFFAKQVEKYFGFKPQINKKYKGGYVTQEHGRAKRKGGGTKSKRNVLQIELGRYLYMKESIQEIDHEQAKKVGAALRMCIQKTGEKFGSQYFKELAA